jgi:hypothetical protein
VTDRGVLLLHGDADQAVAWARRGLVAVSVVPLERGWVGVVASASRAAADAPYDDGVAALLARPVPRRLCPALGLAHVGERLMVAVTSAGLQTRRMWLAWEPGAGLVRPGALPITTVATLARAVGAPQSVEVASRLLRDGRGDSDTVAAELLAALGLPGGALASGRLIGSDLEGAEHVEPEAQGVRRFNRRVRDEERWREEIGG